MCQVRRNYIIIIIIIVVMYLFGTMIITLRFYFLIIRTEVCAWMASTTIHANVSENIPESSATFLQVSHSCTRRLRPVNTTNAKMEYVINRTVLRTTTYVNVLRGTQVFVHSCSLLFVNSMAHYSPHPFIFRQTV